MDIAQDEKVEPTLFDRRLYSLLLAIKGMLETAPGIHFSEERENFLTLHFAFEPGEESGRIKLFEFGTVEEPVEREKK